MGERDAAVMEGVLKRIRVLVDDSLVRALIDAALGYGTDQGPFAKMDAQNELDAIREAVERAEVEKEARHG